MLLIKREEINMFNHFRVNPTNIFRNNCLCTSLLWLNNSVNELRIYTNPKIRIETLISFTLFLLVLQKNMLISFM